MEATPRVVRHGRTTGTFSPRFYKLAAYNVCKLLARTRQARQLKPRLASIVNFMDDRSVREVVRDIRVLVRTVALDREVLQRDLSCKPTLAQFAKEADMSRRAGESHLPNETQLEHLVASTALTGKAVRILVSDLECTELRIKGKKLKAGDPDVRSPNTMICMTTLSFDLRLGVTGLVSCTYVDDGLPDTIVMKPKIFPTTGDYLGYRPMDRATRACLDSKLAYGVRLFGRAGRQRCIGAICDSLGPEHPDLVGEYQHCHSQMSYEDAHAALMRGVLDLEARAHPKVRVVNESQVFDWHSAKHRGGTTNILPAAVLWYLSGPHGGRNFFSDSSDARVLAGACGPVWKSNYRRPTLSTPRNYVSSMA